MSLFYDPVDYSEYLYLQDRCGINVGDRVLVVRACKNYENGWNDSWVEEMYLMVDREYKVEDINECGIVLTYDNKTVRNGYPLGTTFNFPYFVLRKI